MSERGNAFLRALDRSLGIPLVLFLGLLKKKRAGPPRKVGKIALLKTAAIGDTILLSAVVGDLRDTFPNAEISLFVGRNNHEAAAMLEGLNHVMALPVRNPLAAIGLIRSAGAYDLWFDFGQWPRLDALLSAFSRAAWKIGFKTQGQYRHYAYDLAVDHSRDVHEIINYKRLLECVGAARNNYPRIWLDAPEKPSNTVVLHMFAGGYKSYLKEWPPERSRELVNALMRQGYKVVLTGGFDRRAESESFSNSLENKDNVENRVGELRLKETADLLARSRLLISVNTGIVHLAAALKRPMIVLNGPTSVKRWGPLSDSADSLQSPLHCSPCLNLGFDYGCPVNDCMKAISLETVLERAQKILETPS